MKQFLTVLLCTIMFYGCDQWGNVAPYFDNSLLSYNGSLVYIGDNTSLLFTGASRAPKDTQTEVLEFNQTKQTWARVKTSGTVPYLEDAAAVFVASENSVYFFGGITHEHEGTNRFWKYDISKKSWINLSHITEEADISSDHGYINLQLDEYNKRLIGSTRTDNIFYYCLEKETIQYSSIYSFERDWAFDPKSNLIISRDTYIDFSPLPSYINKHDFDDHLLPDISENEKEVFNSVYASHDDNYILNSDYELFNVSNLQNKTEMRIAVWNIIEDFCLQRDISYYRWHELKGEPAYMMENLWLISSELVVNKSDGIIYSFGYKYGPGNNISYIHASQKKGWDVIIPKGTHKPSIRNGAQITVNHDNNTLILHGGFYDNIDYVTIFNDTWIFDIETATWTNIQYTLIKE